MNPGRSADTMSELARAPIDESQEVAPGVNAAPPELADFELIKSIGSGTFGQVWLAKERVTGVHRAIKSFPRTAQDTEITGLCEFQRRNLRHPGLVQIHLVGEDSNSYYVVMDLADDIKGNVALDPQYYEPCSLDRLLKDRGALPVNAALADLRAVLSGVSYLHQQGLVHRDIKPSNVLYVHSLPKLCDFGLVAPGHAAVDRAGTHGYWRPDGPTDRDSDLYAVSKMAFEMLTGADVRHFSELPGDLARVTSPRVYQGIRTLLDRGCAENRAKRFGSAAAMLKHVESLIDEEETPVSAAGRSKKRNLSGWSGTILLATIVMVLIALGVYLSDRPATVFAPLAELSITTFPDGSGNPNAPGAALSANQIAGLTRVVSTNMRNPRAPNYDIRYVKADVVSEPPSHMVIFWIPPEGIISMRTSDDAQRSFSSPEFDAFRKLRGSRGNYVICVLLDDETIENPTLLSDVIEKIRDERIWPELQPRGLRLLSLDQTTPDFVTSAENRDDFAHYGFGLLGQIRNRLGATYRIMGIEIPLPQAQLAPVDPDEGAGEDSTENHS